MDSKLNDLIGRVIDRIFVETKNQESMAFVSNGEAFLYDAFGDCCSNSYFHDLIGVKNLLGQVVSSVDEIDIQDDGWADGDENKVYGYRINTNKGSCVLSFRNESNGYYGGWIERRKGEFSVDMTEIVEDWIGD